MDNGKGKMNRRVFISDLSIATLAAGLPTETFLLTARAENGAKISSNTAQEVPESVLPGTAPLTWQGDLAAQMVDGIHKFLLRRWQDAAEERERLWQRNYQSAEEYG